MTTRDMVGAFLIYGDKVLLMHRGLHKKLAPGMWSAIGGHIEQGELNNPLAACYREIEEETGITGDSIINLRLRYISVRNTEDEIRVVYYFFGNTTEEIILQPCDEGTLHWVDIRDIPTKPMTFSVEEITRHWLANPDSDSVYVCCVNKDNNHSTWGEL